MALYNRSSILNSIIVGRSIISIRSIMRRLRHRLKEYGSSGACPTLTVLLRRTICDRLLRSRPEKILNVFQRIHFRFFRACGLAPGRTSFASSRTAMSDRLLGFVPFLIALGFFLQGCGLVFDAVELVHPLARHELSAICSQGQVRVGISVEPFRPFVFPAVYTDEGVLSQASMWS